MKKRKLLRKDKKYLYEASCGYRFSSIRKMKKREIYCPETDCKTCIEKRIK